MKRTDIYWKWRLEILEAKEKERAADLKSLQRFQKHLIEFWEAKEEDWRQARTALEERLAVANTEILRLRGM